MHSLRSPQTITGSFLVILIPSQVLASRISHSPIQTERNRHQAFSKTSNKSPRCFKSRRNMIQEPLSKWGRWASNPPTRHRRFQQKCVNGVSGFQFFLFWLYLSHAPVVSAITLARMLLYSFAFLECKWYCFHFQIGLHYTENPSDKR